MMTKYAIPIYGWFVSEIDHAKDHALWGKCPSEINRQKALASAKRCLGLTIGYAIGIGVPMLILLILALTR